MPPRERMASTCRRDKNSRHGVAFAEDREKPSQSRFDQDPVGNVSDAAPEPVAERCQKAGVVAEACSGVCIDACVEIGLTFGKHLKYARQRVHAACCNHPGDNRAERAGCCREGARQREDPGAHHRPDNHRGQRPEREFLHGCRSTLLLWCWRELLPGRWGVLSLRRSHEGLPPASMQAFFICLLNLFRCLQNQSESGPRISPENPSKCLLTQPILISNISGLALRIGSSPTFPSFQGGVTERFRSLEREVGVVIEPRSAPYLLKLLTVIKCHPALH